MKKTLLALLLTAPAFAQDIEGLIKQMTVEEKFGQIQQFTGFGFTTGPTAVAEGEKQKALIRQGKVGSILNSVGAKVTSDLQSKAWGRYERPLPILVVLAK